MTYQLFDKLALLSVGETCYFGPVNDAPEYFNRIGYDMPPATNPAEFFLDLINIDLDKNGEVIERTQHIIKTWKSTQERRALDGEIERVATTPSKSDLAKLKILKASPWMVPLTLLAPLLD
ncbi:hypothetical protein NW767_015757 [Fusarium falciforme]|nr:hypothetical protein NW767_015757 [Fusarium falciforme]KAJ4212681.1 hypothetical protein NW757_014777 [Fusarium falciforme]